MNGPARLERGCLELGEGTVFVPGKQFCILYFDVGTDCRRCSFAVRNVCFTVVTEAGSVEELAAALVKTISEVHERAFEVTWAGKLFFFNPLDQAPGIVGLRLRRHESYRYVDHQSLEEEMAEMERERQKRERLASREAAPSNS